MKQSLVIKHSKIAFCISSQLYGLEVRFWCGDSFRTDDEIMLHKYKKQFYTKNDCFHKVKELRKGHTKENKKLINVFC